MTLVDFLLARLAEDETWARDAADKARGPWRARQVFHDGFMVGSGEPVKRPGSVVVWNATGQMVMDTCSEYDGAVGFHIARHDPARVLAECEAKRRIVEEHEVPPGGYQCIVCCVDAEAVPHPCPTMRLLALPFADHPDYDEGWRP